MTDTKPEARDERVNDWANPTSIERSEFYFSDALRSLQLGRELIFLVVWATMMLALSYLMLATPKYESVAVIGAKTDDSFNLPGSGAMSGSLKALLKAPTQNSSLYTLLLESLTSRSLADALTKDDRILTTAFSSYYDKRKGKWEGPGPIGQFMRFLRAAPPWNGPNGEELRYYISKHLVVSTDLENDITTISFKDKDPAFSAYFVATVLKTADELIRQHDRDDSAARIANMQNKISTVSIADVRSSLIESLSQEYQRQATIEANRYYTANVIDPPEQVRYVSSPKVPIVLALGLVAGVGLGSLLAMLRYLRGARDQFSLRRFYRHLRSLPRKGLRPPVRSERALAASRARQSHEPK